MKANKAPEKIWIDNLDEGFWFDSPSGNKSVEYTRTDAFIEKACSYIRLYSVLLDTENNDCMPEWLDKFRNAMKK